ncbi:MAG: transglycosylase SLT domain-containing protein, partial [Gammaproteobacteria bacterium]
MTRHLALFSAGALLSLLAACATPPPPPEAPAETLPESSPEIPPEDANLPPAVTRPTLGAADVAGADEGDGGADAAVVAADEPPAELITLLRGRFALPPAGRAEVEQHADWYARHNDYLNRVFERARPFLPYIAAEVEARGLPGELAFLPVVESAFDPFAYSHGRAAGLWQIIPSTGSHFGLKQNWWYDGRRDVLASTEMALNYLEYLHELFGGDWLLAVAAYNCGQGTVARAIRRNQSLG